MVRSSLNCPKRICAIVHLHSLLGILNLDFVLITILLWIRIRMDPELLPGSGSGIIVADPDPERADK